MLCGNRAGLRENPGENPGTPYEFLSPGSPKACIGVPPLPRCAHRALPGHPRDHMPRQAGNITLAGQIRQSVDIPFICATAGRAEFARDRNPDRARDDRAPGSASTLLPSPCIPDFAGMAEGWEAGKPYGREAGTPYGWEAGTPYGWEAGTPYGRKPGTPYGWEAGTPYGRKPGTPYGFLGNVYGDPGMPPGFPGSLGQDPALLAVTGRRACGSSCDVGCQFENALRLADGLQGILRGVILRGDPVLRAVEGEFPVLAKGSGYERHLVHMLPESVWKKVLSLLQAPAHS